MDHETAITTAEDFQSGTSADYSKEIEAIIQQNSEMLEISAEMLQDVKEIRETAAHIAEYERFQMVGSVVSMIALGIICGLIFVLLAKGR